MQLGSRAIPCLVTGLVAVLAPGAIAASGNFMLIRRDVPVQIVEVAEIGEQRVVLREDGGGWANVSRKRCVALLRLDAVVVPRLQGWLRLADGQRFPGQALSGARVADGVFVWSQSSWLGRLNVPLDRIASVTFSGSATVPSPGDADVLVLANGDRVEGFVTALGDPVSLEVPNDDDGGYSFIDLPLGRVHAVRMVTPKQKPTGHRLWFTDGTITGTSLVHDIAPPILTIGSDPVLLARSGGRLFLGAGAPGQRQLWSSDGTAAGTVPLTKLSRATDIGETIVLGERIFFRAAADDPATGKHVGHELWVLHRKSGVVQLLGDLWPGPFGSYPYGMLAFGGELFFTSADGALGVGVFGLNDDLLLNPRIGRNQPFAAGEFALKGRIIVARACEQGEALVG